MKLKVSFKDITEKSKQFFGTKRGLVVAFTMVAVGSFSLARMSNSKHESSHGEHQVAEHHENSMASHDEHNDHKGHDTQAHGDDHVAQHDSHGSHDSERPRDGAHHDTAKTDAHGEHQEAIAEKSHHRNFAQKLFDAVRGVQHTADELAQADMENFRLRLENANLRQWGEALRFNCAGKYAEERTKEFEGQLKDQTGTQVGRTLASIDYRPPPHLLPDQLYTLGVSYLHAKEYEKSAVIFTFLTGLEEYPGFQTAQNYLMTGVSWYKVDHLNLAKSFFEKSLAKSEMDWKVFEGSHSEDHSKASMIKKNQVQSRLWRALVAKRMSNNPESQDWLKQVIGRHPSSIEAAWVNPAARVKQNNQSNDGSKHESSH